jgi:hypothetical protein
MTSENPYGHGPVITPQSATSSGANPKKFVFNSSKPVTTGSKTNHNNLINKIANCSNRSSRSNSIHKDFRSIKPGTK